MADEKPTSEQGYQVNIGLSSWAGFVNEQHELNPALNWPLSIDVFDRMRREDAQVGSVLRAVTMPVRSAHWVLDPAGCEPAVVDLVAEDLGVPVKGRNDDSLDRTGRDRFSWAEHLRLALLELVYGHSVFEQVYRIDDAGLARLRKLAWRPPRTISKFEVARDGGLVSVSQHGTTDPIPVDRLVVYVNEREGGNWVGTSLLRSAYKNNLLKDRMLRAQALTIERNGLGVPTYIAPEVPEGVTGEARKRWVDEQIKQGLEIAKGFRAGETAGVALPHGGSFKLEGVTGKLPATDEPIRYHDEQIARAVLAHFLNLGTETGSWALGSTFADFFTNSLNAVAQHIADVTQQHVVEDLVQVNWGEGVRAPRLVCEPIGSQHPATSTAIKELIDAGAIEPDEALQAWVREKWGLPVGSGGAEAAAGGDVEPVGSDAEQARFAAETAQKVYLATDKTVLTQEEARDLVARSGAVLSQVAPDTQRIPDQSSSPAEGDTEEEEVTDGEGEGSEEMVSNSRRRFWQRRRRKRD